MVELDQIDSALLETLQRDGRASFESLGRKVGLTRIAARNRVQRLLDRGVIEIITAIHPLAQGLRTFGHLSVKVSAPAVPIAEAMAREQALPFVALVSGEFAVIAEARTESAAMLRSTVESIQGLPGVDHVTTSLYTERLRDRHSSGRAADPVVPPRITNADTRLLAALQEDSRASFADLARRSGLSPGSARTHVKRMREDGIIHIGAIVRPGATSDFGHVCGIGIRTKSTAKLACQLMEMPQVHYLTHCLGSWNLIGTLRCRTIAETAEVLDQIRADDVDLESWTHLRLIKEDYEVSPSMKSTSGEANDISVRPAY